MLKDSDRKILLFRSRFMKQKDYWIKKLSGEFDVTDIVLGYDKKHTGKVDNAKVEIPIPNELGNRVIKLSKGSDLSTYIFLLAALKCLIFRYTSIEDIIIISPINKHKVKEEIINSLLFIRNQVDETLTFKELVMKVRQSVLEAYENQDYPYDKLLEYLFPSPGEQNKQVITNTMCSLGNLHNKRDIDKINTRFSFQFSKTVDQVNGCILYSTDTCEESEVVRLANHFVHLLVNAVENLNVKISGIPFLTEQEKTQLLVDFNNNRRDFPGDRSIYHFIEEHAKKTPDAVAVAFMDRKLTYRDLNKRSNQLARHLRDSGVREDQPVGILLDRSPQMVESILAVWKAGGAYIPLEPGYPHQRILEILNDSQAAVLISASKHLNVNCEISSYDKIINLDDKKNDKPMDAKEEDLEIDMRCLSYIIYTSGSTGKPKGVMVEHIGMMNHISAKINDLCLTGRTIVAQNSSHTFDISVWQFFTALTLGGKTVIFPNELMFQLDQFISGIIREQVTILEVVPSHLSAILEFLDIDSRRMEYLDYLLVTGETVTPPLVKRWFDRYPGIRMVNAYGPTEASDDITHFVMDKAPDGERIPIGNPIQNLNIYIVDKNMNLCPVGVKGEICVSGIGVGRGYLNNVAQTRRVFTRTPFIEAGRGRLYKTGDLGRWLTHGTIEFFGRKDYQVKIRGFRIELGEIESQLAGHPQIKEAVVIVKEATDKYLCAYLVTVNEEKLDIPAVKEYLSERLPDYMIPEHLLELEHMPQTPNGKIDRKALCQLDVVPFIKKEYVAPRTEVEKKLAEIWSELLDKEKESIGIDANFFEMGGHSLNATIMAAKTHKKINVTLPITEVFKTPTIRGLAGYIQGAAEEKYASLESAEKREYYALSSAQKRLYIHQQMDTGNTSYNIPKVVTLEGQLNNERLEEIFRKLIARHESLRTSFEIVGEEHIQRIHDKVEFDIEYYDMGNSEKLMPNAFCLMPEPIIKNFIRPFVLSRGPLLRVGLIKLAKKKHMLLMDMHHIVMDGVSQRILVQDFISLYSGRELQELRVQYKDCCQWQKSDSQKERIKPQETYWLEALGGEIPVLNIPTDYVRPAIHCFAGRTEGFEIEAEYTRALKVLALEKDITLYMVLLAIFNVFLSKISGQEDIVLGTATAGRRHDDLEQVIGMFVNTLVLKNSPYCEKTFIDFLKKVTETTLEAFENQDYPHEALLEKMAVNRSPSRNPLFDVVFVLQDLVVDKTEIREFTGLTLTPYEYDTNTAKFDLTLQGWETSDKLLFTFEYSTKLFKYETIRRFIDYFKRIISSIIDFPGKRISEIEIASESEKRQILIDFNNTGTGCPPHQTIHQLFEHQAETRPGKIAVVEIGSHPIAAVEGNQLTYKELNQKANQLARKLRAKGIKPDHIVGLMAERSLEMIVGILGILKAGGAYLPIDPQYPGKRVKYMLADGKPELVLVQPRLIEITGFMREYCECLGIECSGRAALQNAEHINTPKDLSYVMFTSGSTGKAKGVMVEHRSVVRLVIHNNFVELSHQTRILQTGAPVFDATTFEIWGSLLNGGQLYLPANELILDVNKLGQSLMQNKINTLWLTVTLFNHLVQQNSSIFSGLKYLLVGGDILSPRHINRVRARNKELKIINGYGPTENTTFSACHLIEKDYENNIPVGKPISRSTVYILDKNGRLQPVCIPGELYVGGDGVSRGYSNQPQLTNKKFIQNPFLAGDRLYQTGDLGRWLPDGTIEFLGRVDHQVKIRGFRIELGEIENQLLNHGAIVEALVIAKEDKKDEKYLCAYVVPGGDVSLPELRKHLAEELPNHMIPAYFVLLERIPLTANGKVDRDALPLPEPETNHNVLVAPRNQIEDKLAEIWSEVLGIQKNMIGIDSDFFQLGGHSLRATAVLLRVHKEFDVKVGVVEMFTNPTLRELAGHICKTKPDKFPSIKPVEEKEYYLMSPAQKRMFLLNHFKRNDTSDNTPEAIMVEGKLHRRWFENVFGQLVKRHEVLRTSFEYVNEQPVQKVHKDLDFRINLIEAEYPFGSKENDATFKQHLERIIKRFIRPFDLGKAPLLRVSVVKLSDEKHLLLYDIHHIIKDGTSSALFIKEFFDLSNGRKLPALRIQYKDFASWQNKGLQSGIIQKQEAYWLSVFPGEIPQLNMPTDYPRPSVQSLEGGCIFFQLDRQQSQGIKKMASEYGATLFMVLLAIYNVLLSKYTGQEDIVVGTPIAGRPHDDLKNVMGMFVNTLAMRNYPKEEKDFSQFLKEVKANSLNAYENQDYQFEELVNKLGSQRDPARSVLFDTMFAVQNMKFGNTGKEIKGLLFKPYNFDIKVTQFDIMFHAFEKGEILAFKLLYSSKLFKRETIERLTDYFREIIISVIANKHIKLEDITLSHDLEMITSDVPHTNFNFN